MLVRILNNEILVAINELAHKEGNKAHDDSVRSSLIGTRYINV